MEVTNIVEKKTKKQVYFAERKAYLEIYGKANVVEFSLLNHKMKPAHGYFRCKDYYNDYFYSLYTNKTGTIYGFSTTTSMIEENKELVNQDKVRFVLRYRDENSNINNDKLNSLEDTAKIFLLLLGLLDIDKFKNFTIRNTEDKDILFELPIEMTYHPFFVSIITTFMRISVLKHKKDISQIENLEQLFQQYEDFEFNDKTLFNKSFFDIYFNMKNIYSKKFFEYSYPHYFSKKNINYSGIHNNGWVTILQNVLVKNYSTKKEIDPSLIDKNKTLKDFFIEVEKEFTQFKEQNSSGSAPVSIE